MLQSVFAKRKTKKRESIDFRFSLLRLCLDSLLPEEGEGRTRPASLASPGTRTGTRVRERMHQHEPQRPGDASQVRDWMRAANTAPLLVKSSAAAAPVSLSHQLLCSPPSSYTHCQSASSSCRQIDTHTRITISKHLFKERRNKRKRKRQQQDR